jgi:type VI secretion system secreted protein VgrG
MPDATAQDIATKSWIEVSFQPDPGFKMLFDGLHGREELGRPFFYDVELSSGTLQKDVGKKLVGTSCTVWLAQSDENTEDRYLNGVVTRVVSSGLVGGVYRYRIEVRPWIWLLSRIVDSLIFQKMKAFDIITKVFRDAGFSNFEDKRQANAGDTELEYCVQYRESSFDFVHRLMEQFGIYYFFKHEDGKHTLCLADDPNAHDTLSDKIPFVFDQTENRTVDDHIWEWQAEFGLESGKFTFRDYNFTTPSADLTAKTLKPGDHDSYKDLEHYDYPGPYEETAVGQKLTDVRMQAIAMQRTVLDGVSNSRALHPGWRFKMDHHPEADLNRDYLITRAEFSIGQAEATSRTEGDTLDTYRVTLRAIPGDVPFRLERYTPVPMIRGPQTAKVVGESGEEITTDEYGRVKVQFHWDRSDTPEDQRSCWIRVAQASAGVGWGSIFIPRAGQEVVVEFLEGNPDRPLITGVVYNATNKVPYSLPGNKTQSGIKTNSSKGGSGFNELRFEDKSGEEEVFFQAQKDFNKNILNNETSKVKNDHTTTIESGNHTTTVSSGNHKLDVSSGTSEISAATSITLKVGGNSIKIDTSGVTINGTKIEASATGSHSISGATVSVSGNGSVSISAPSVAIN